MPPNENKCKRIRYEHPDSAISSSVQTAHPKPLEPHRFHQTELGLTAAARRHRGVLHTLIPVSR